MTRLQKISALASRLGVDAIMLTSEVNMHYAIKYPRLEGIILVMPGDKGTVLTDSRYIEVVTGLVTPMGYEAVEPEGSYPTPQTVLSFVNENGIRSLGFENTRMSVMEYETYKAILPCELVPIHYGMEEIRRVKEPWEIEQICAAQKIADDALNAVLPLIKPGAYEDEIATELRHHLGLGGTEDFAEGMICVSGAKTSMPHGIASHKMIEDGDFMTIDFGAMVNGYFSDMTRTFGVGHLTQKQKDVYRIVQEAQLAGIEAFQIGAVCQEVDKAARDVIRKAGYGDYFGHGLGHSLGLEIHEKPMANKTYEGIYQLNDITTIEPGIYIPGEFGVRIEDMIYIDEDGKHNLTPFPKELMIL